MRVHREWDKSEKEREIVVRDYTITIDGGTTNTRCILWDSHRKKVGEESRAVGVRNTSIDGNNHALKQALKSCLDQLIEKNQLAYDQVGRIIGSGMLTSDVGLVNIPWISAPAGIQELAEHTVDIQMPEICPVPISFIPGIRNSGENIDLDRIESMDVMRGEEVEAVAIIERCHAGKPMLLVLPGSHNKFVAVDAHKKITGCLTSISGELLDSITNHTIIAKSVHSEFVPKEAYDQKWLFRGYDTAKKTGLGRACFTSRILMLFFNEDPEKLANFILGAVLAEDIKAVHHTTAIQSEREMQVVVGGKQPLRTAVADLLIYDGYFSSVEEFEPDRNIPLSAEGAYLVAQEKGIL